MRASPCPPYPSLRWMAYILSVLLALAGVISYVIADGYVGTSNATCSATYDWARNSLEQSPCDVTAQLVATNLGENITLTPGGDIPNNFNTDWACGVQLYSLAAACCDCQSESWLTWQEWTANCTEVYHNFQGTVPSSTVIPPWADLDVTEDGTYSRDAAQDEVTEQQSASASSSSSVSAASASAASASESSASASSASAASVSEASVSASEASASAEASQASAASASASSVSAASLTSASAASVSSIGSSASAAMSLSSESLASVFSLSAASVASASSVSAAARLTSSTIPSATATANRDPTITPTPKKSHVGEIAGGAVGGVAVLALFAFSVLWCLNRRSESMDTVPGYPAAPSVPQMQHTAPTSPTRLYNPEDPTTFPPPMPSTLYGASHSRATSISQLSPGVVPAHSNQYALANPFATPLPTPGAHGRPMRTVAGPPSGYIKA